MWLCITSPYFALIGQYGAEILPKSISNMASVRHLEFAKFRFFVQWPSWEWECASAYQIWSKSDNSRLRYGDKTIFKMAAVLHLEFAKIAVLVTCVYRHMILHLRSKFRVDRPIWRRDIAKKRFSIWRPSAILDLVWRHHIASEKCILFIIKSRT